jgi:hypothetical protein
MAQGIIRRADTAADFRRFGVNPGAVEASEDGLRLVPAPGNFEWWYFEVATPEALIVIIFLTKDPTRQAEALNPMLSIKVRFLDSRDVEHGGEWTPAASAFAALDTHCKVSIGPRSSCEMTAPGQYLIKFDETVANGGERLHGEIRLESWLPPARIGTGHLMFEKDQKDQYIGWVVPVPAGVATVDCMVGNRAIKSQGHGYHDHNWGDQRLDIPIHHWYWGRSGVVTPEGKFVVIAANTVGDDDYGRAQHRDLLLYKDGVPLAMGHAGVDYIQADPLEDPALRTPVAGAIQFRFVREGTAYIATFTRFLTVHKAPLGSSAYHRFGGLFSLAIVDAGGMRIYTNQEATWELMWIGNGPQEPALALYTRMIAVP